MSLSQHQEQLLGRTEQALNRCAPDLAAMLAAFTAVNQSEPMPAHERLPAHRSGRIRAAAWLALLVSRLGPVCGELLMTAGIGWGASYCLDGGFADHGTAEPRTDR